MASVKIARGARAACPDLALGEMFFATDTRELFVGNGLSNVPLAGCQWHGTISITNEEGAYQFTFAEHGLPDCGQYAVQLTSDAPYRMAVLNRSSSGFLVQIYDDAGEARNPLWDTVVTCNLGVFCGEGIHCGQVTPLTVDIHAYLDFAEQ